MSPSLSFFAGEGERDGERFRSCLFNGDGERDGDLDVFFSTLSFFLTGDGDLDLADFIERERLRERDLDREREGERLFFCTGEGDRDLDLDLDLDTFLSFLDGLLLLLLLALLLLLLLGERDFERFAAGLLLGERAFERDFERDGDTAFFFFTGEGLRLRLLLLLPFLAGDFAGDASVIADIVLQFLTGD